MYKLLRGMAMAVVFSISLMLLSACGADGSVSENEDDISDGPTILIETAVLGVPE